MSKTNPASKTKSPPREPSPHAFTPWFLLTFVSLNYFVLYLHRSVIGFVQPPLKSELGISDVDFGWLQPAFVIPYGVAQLFVGYLGDRFNRRRVLLISIAASIFFVACLGCAQNYWQMVVLRILLGLAQAPSIPAIASMMGDSFSARNRSTAVAIYLSSFNAALVVAGRYGGQLADSEGWRIPIPQALTGWVPGAGPSAEAVMGRGGELLISGWRTAFLAFALVGLVVAILMAIGLREPKRAEMEPDSGGADDAAPVGSWSETLRQILSVRSFVALAIIFVLFSVVNNVKDFWLARYYHERFGLTLKDAGSMATIWLQAGTMCGLLLGGPWADYWALRQRLGRAAVQMVGFAAWVPALIVIGTSGQFLMLNIAMALFGLGAGLYQANLWTTTFEVLPATVRSTAVGLLNVLAVAASLATPLVGRLHSVLGKGTEKGAGLGIIFVSMSLVAAGVLLLYVYYMARLLPRDYRGPLAPPNR